MGASSSPGSAGSDRPLALDVAAVGTIWFCAVIASRLSDGTNSPTIVAAWPGAQMRDAMQAC